MKTSRLRAIVVLVMFSSVLGIVAIVTSGQTPDSDESTNLKLGIVGDGVTDDTASIQAAVNAQPGGLFLPHGTYRITKPIEIELDQDGPQSIFSDGTATIVMEGAGPALRFVGTHDGTASPQTFQASTWKRQRAPMVDGLEIIGRHPEASGIQASGTMQLTITRVVLRQLKHGIHVIKRNRNLIISNCHIYENRGIGIYYDHVNLHQSNIVGCHISYNHGGGVVIRGGDVRNVHLGTCDVEANMGGPDSAPTANVLLDSTGGSIGEVAVVGCTIQHTHNAPNSANIRVNGNSTARPFTAELRHGNITIADNVLSDVQVNVHITNTRGVTVTGNTLWKGYESNLLVEHCDSVVVCDNVFDRNPRYHYGDGSNARLGILFRDCDGGTISGNHIGHVGPRDAAMTLEDCDHFNVVACTILDCSPCGLLLKNVSHSRISDCLIRNAAEEGGPFLSLRTMGGSGNLIVDNLLGHGREDRAVETSVLPRP